MSSQREVLIRILALLQRKTLLETKKCTLKCFKTALFDCAISEKCCNVDGGQGICPLFPSHGNLPSNVKKMLMPGGQPGEEGGWAQLELTDA